MVSCASSFGATSATRPDSNRRILDLTRGHPCLVQLLCAEIVALKNEQPAAERWRVQVSDVETAVPRALESGHLFFVDIQRNQVDEAALLVLKLIASRGEGVWTSREALAQSFTDNLNGCLDVLSRRDVIERSDPGYRFQVELIRRWFERLDSDAVHP